MEDKSENTSNTLKNKTVKGLFFGGLSNALQQIIGFLFGLIVARNFLSPSDYGIISIITIFAVIATAFQESGFIMGLVNKKTIAQKDYNAVFYCSIMISTVLYVILYNLAPLIADYYNLSELTKLSRFTFISFWIASFSISHNAYLFRNLLVIERSITMLVALILSNIVGLILAYKGYAYWSLATQTVVYTLISTILLTYFSKFRPTLNINLNPIKEIFGFSSKILITNIFININNNIYGAVLSRYFTTHQIGYLTQASKWNIMGQSLIINMINNVLQPVLNQIQEDFDRQTRVFRKVLNFTSFIAFILLFGLAFVAEDFIKIALTEKWDGSAIYVKILCIGGAFATINNVFANLILSKGKSSIYMFNIISFGLLQLIILLLSKKLGITYSIVLVSSLNLVWVFIWFSTVKNYITFSIINLFEDVFTYMLFAAIACFTSSIICDYIDNIYLSFISGITLSLVFYIILNKLFKPAILTELLDFLLSYLSKKSK